MGRPRPAVGGSHSHSLDSVPSPGLGQRKYLCAGVPKGAYSVGCWELKRKFRLISICRARCANCGGTLCRLGSTMTMDLSPENSSQFRITRSRSEEHTSELQ